MATTTTVTEPLRAAHRQPWPAGETSHWVRIGHDTMTGRRIVTLDA